MFVLLRIDTQNYGWVLSTHSNVEAADSAYMRRTRRLPPGTLVHLMYRICETTVKVKKGERVRFSDLNG